VLNLGGSVSQTTPQASFGFDYDVDAGTSSDNGSVTITHETGDSIEPAQLDTTGLADEAGGDWDSLSDTVSAGDSVTLYNSEDWDGETIRVVWNSENNENSATLSESTAPTE
jgi:hypothetical protein